MIRKVVFGTPFDTEAVVGDSYILVEELPYLKQVGAGNFVYSMDEDTALYGLGENIRGINKRGWIYVSHCSDDPSHTEEKVSLYGAHNFFLVDGKERFGVFVDDPGDVTFDVGYTDMDLLQVKTSEDVAIYVIDDCDTLEGIVRAFRTLVGQSYIPPKWAFGYGQSRWSYMSADEIRELVRFHREKEIPLDSVYVDIDYMEGYKDFTINQETFPEFASFVEEMKEEGVHLVPIIDAGVKIEPGYEFYEEGVKNGYFCKDKAGNDFIVGVWPGDVHLPDMLNKDAREWFGNGYSFLLEKGIEGFWNDMNEPALFYSKDHLDLIRKKVEEVYGDLENVEGLYHLKGMLNQMSNNPEDYKRFYHEHKDGRVRHDKVHNLFGYNMTRAAGEAFTRLVPDKRILMFSRSSYIGMHRYGGIWTGDNQSFWSHILLNLQMMPSLNMCGFLYVGADLGGFGSNVTEDLMLRWLALGVFTPLMRNHSAMGTRRQEISTFKHQDWFRSIINLRYQLLPYLYSEFMKAALNHGMFMKPLAFVYENDPFAKQVEDQLMVGESIMIAPVYVQNAKGRMVYLPESMKVIRHKNGAFVEEAVLEPGHHYVSVALDEVVFLLRKDHILPVTKAAKCVSELEGAEITYLSYVVDGATYQMYEDDGYCMDYENPQNIREIHIG